MGEEEEAGPCVDLEEDPLVAEEDRDAALAPEDKEFYTPTIASGGDMHAATEEMSKALGWLMRLAENPGWEGPPEEDPGMWLEKLTQGMPDPDQFRAGRLREHVGVLEAYFKEAGNATGAGKKVLRWMREGINWPRVAVQEPGQEAAPFHKKKLGIVRAMLAKAIPTGDKVEDYLQGGKPRRVCFPNHQSTVDYASFLEEELDGMLAKGVVKEWAAADPPVVVNGLRVVDEKFPKLRLCIIPMYLNLFMRYKPVQYERLSEVADMAMEGDYAFTTDDKSGYWQCPLHVEMWKYLAFRVKGKTYCFTHLPFGLAPACYVYTFIKQEIYRPLRAAGLRMAFLIDDQISLQRGVARTRCQSGAMCKLLAALGWTLSLPKCQLEPSQLLRFLGLMVDLKDRSFRVPEDKKQQLQSLVAELTSAVVVSDRIIAKVAGKVMALSLALDLAPLLARGMMKAMQGRTRWDKLYPTPEALKEDMSLMVEMMGTSEGRRWSLRSESISVIRVVGDASETQLAAFTPNNEWEGVMVVPYTEEQMRAMEENKWSSTARELSVLPALLNTMEQQRPGLLRGKRLQYGTDSQAGMQAVMGMKGNANTFPIVREVRLLAASLGTELEVVWRRRDHEEQQLADDYSKLQDDTDWSLHPEVYASIVRHKVGSLVKEARVVRTGYTSFTEGNVCIPCC